MIARICPCKCFGSLDVLLWKVPIVLPRGGIDTAEGSPSITFLAELLRIAGVILKKELVHLILTTIGVRCEESLPRTYRMGEAGIQEKFDYRESNACHLLQPQETPLRGLN